MGKRLLFMILAVLLVLWGLSGCRKAEPDDGNAENSEENSLSAASESSTSGEGTASALDQTNTGKLAMIHYRVTDRIYHNDTKSLCYPQIIGLSNTETETVCNAWIEEIAMRVLQSDARCELSYEVTSETPQLLSLFITEKRYPEDAAEPQMQYYTLNLDVQTGSVLTLSDFVDLKILARDVVTGECTVEKNAEAAGDYLFGAFRRYACGRISKLRFRAGARGAVRLFPIFAQESCMFCCRLCRRLADIWM